MRSLPRRMTCSVNWAQMSYARDNSNIFWTASQMALNPASAGHRQRSAQRSALSALEVALAAATSFALKAPVRVNLKRQKADS